MLKVVVAEDDKECIDVMKRYLTEFSRKEDIPITFKVYTDGMSFLDEYETDTDIVFMDIVMPHMNGLEAAARLRKRDGNVCLIFITTMSQYAVKGYEVDALDFLIKPVSYDLFSVKMKKAADVCLKRAERSYTLKTSDGLFLVKYSDIIYVEGDKHYLIFHTKSCDYRVRKMMRDIENDFKDEGFALASGSLLINLLYVSAFKGTEVTVAGEILPVGRNYKQNFFESLSIYIGGKL